MCFSLTNVLNRQPKLMCLAWGKGVVQKMASFLGTLARFVKCSSVSPWQAAGIWGASLWVNAVLQYLGDVSNSRFHVFLKCSKEGKTKTLYNLLNYLRSLTLCFMNKSEACLWIPCHIVVHEIKRTVWQGETWLWKKSNSAALKHTGRPHIC